MAKTKNEVAETSTKSVTAAPDIDLYEDAGSGLETMGKDDLAIPRIHILQPLSPVCIKKTDEYVDGAESGHFWHSVDEKWLDGEKGLIIVPISYRLTYIEWGLREDGGGFKADHGNKKEIQDACIRDDKNRYINKEGNQIVQTAEYFVFIIGEDGAPEPIMMSMAGSQLKKSRQLNTKLKQLLVERPDGQGKFNPAMFYSAYKATTVPEKNDKGNWMGWKLERHLDTLELEGGSDIYLAAREFNKQIAAGAVKVHAPEAESVPAEEDDSAPM